MVSFGSVQKTGEYSWKLTVSGGFDGGGKRIRHTKTVRVTSDNLDTQEKEARHQLALFIAEIEKGQAANSGKMTLAQFYEFWKENFSSKNHEPTTLSYNDFIFRRIREALGSKRLDKIEPKHLLSFYKNLGEPGIKKVQQKKDSTEPPLSECLSAVTIRKHHALLSSLLATAVKWNMIAYNPAERVEPPKAVKTHKEVYSQETLGQFLQILESEEIKYQLMVMLALTGGLRREEIFGLEWKHINFETCTVSIHQASVYIPEAGTITKSTKNHCSNRTVSIPATVMTVIYQHNTNQAAERSNLGDTWKNSDRVFTQWNGIPAHPHSFNTWLKRFIARNNLPHLSPHLLRHMNATYLIAGGTDVRTVSGKLGHAQTSTTMNIYSHLLQSAEQETANTMETFLQQTTDKAKETQTRQAK
jgi:integrase